MEPKKSKKSEVIFLISLIYIMVTFIGLHVAKYMYPVASSAKNVGRLNKIPQNAGAMNFGDALGKALSEGIKNPFDLAPFRSQYLLVFLIVTVVVGLFSAYFIFRDEAHKVSMNKNQCGSAKWNDNLKKHNEEFTTPWENPKEMADPNIILSKNVKLGYRIKELKNKRNLNVLIIGGSGTGKTFRFIKPNLMQMNCSAIVTDPSGEIMECTGKALIKNGTKVKLFSLTDMTHSNCYNPLDYVYDENGKVDETKVSSLVYTFIKNANGSKQKSGGDPFWEKSEKAFLSAIIFYLLENESVPDTEKNFTSVLKMTQLGKVEEGSESSQSKLDALMASEEKMARENGRESKAMSNYKTFKLAPPKTANSILITCAVDLQLFDNKGVQHLTRTDTEEDTNNLHLERLGDEKTVLFINIPQADGTFNFLVAMLYSQLFNAIYTKGEKISPHRYNIFNKYKEPLLTQFKSEEEAKEAIELLKTAKVEKRVTKRGAEFFQIKNGKKVLGEFMSEDYANKIIRQASEEGTVVKRGSYEFPFKIRCLMDEFANIGEIPDFEKYLSTMRKYGLSCSVVLQTISQIKGMYEKSWEGIVDNCDSIIFLGGKGMETCKYISEILGKATIEVKGRGNSKSAKSGSSSENFSFKDRALMMPEEIAKMDGDKEIVIIRGEDPFLDDKYNFLAHPNFAQCGDSDPGNKMDYETLDAYFNSVPVEKKQKKTKKKVQQLLPVTPVEINSKEDLLDLTGSRTDEEFLKKTCSSPAVKLPKHTSKVIKNNASEPPQATIVPTDESSAFTFG